MNCRVAGLLILAGCAGHAAPPAGGPPAVHGAARGGAAPVPDTGGFHRLPPVPSIGGPLRISVVYPDSTARLDVRDSTFLFGSLGDGRATLRIEGQPIPVAPNGAWLAWIPLPSDTLIRLHLEATTPGDTARIVYPLRRARRFVPPAGKSVWIDSTSFQPAGRVWWPRDEFLPLSVRASEGARVVLQLPGRRAIPLTADSSAEPVPEAIRAFDRDPANLVRPVRADRYRGLLRGIEIADPPARRAGPAGPLLLAIRGRDTARMVWPLHLTLLDTLPVVVELDPDPDRTGASDGLTKGRTVPGGTYTWFFPAGTRARVRGRINDDLRIALSRSGEAWVPAREARPASGPTEAVVGSITLSPRPDRVVARIPVGVRLPYQVVEEANRLSLLLYGGRSDVNWLRYGRDDSLVALVTTRQAAADELEVRFDLTLPVWGYRARWEGTDLLFEIRRPPAIAARRPLAGLTIALDPGHPPLGATGPTGFLEAEANLLVAQQLAPLLEREGARVVLTRTDARPVALAARVARADSAGADLLISLHNNALPDGVNPFANHGTSVFYNHPRALPLARAIQRRLVALTGLPDLGVARGDLALTRATWMPAVLTEGMFLMIPEQEAALRSAEGRRLYALAVLEGVRSFLLALAR